MSRNPLSLLLIGETDGGAGHRGRTSPTGLLLLVLNLDLVLVVLLHFQSTAIASPEAFRRPVQGRVCGTAYEATRECVWARERQPVQILALDS